jgi:alkylation response protein AidB-like acyl-CoA dehydrogenase
MSRVREIVENGRTPGLSPDSAASALGLTSLLIPAECGGLGGGQVELGLVCEELGRGLYPGSLFATAAMATNTLLVLADQKTKVELLPEIAAGQLTATLALFEDDGDWVETEPDVAASNVGDAWRLRGAKTFVLDGSSADLILVTARTGTGVSLFGVQRGAVGARVHEMDVLDRTREIASITFDDTPARILSVGDVRERIGALMDRVNVALAAEQVGVARKCLKMSVDYSLTRNQFGRPIGSFQAIKHRCANMLLAVETARSAVQYAAWSLDAKRPEAARAASIAAAAAAEAGPQVSADTIQIHGGMGFTWECDAHLYYKRATAQAMLFGGADFHYRRLADRLKNRLSMNL